MSLRRFSTLALVTAAAAACADLGTAPDPSPQFAKGGNGGGSVCPSPTVVVSDEASLLAAVAGAVPGDVIGVDGTVTLASDRVWITAPGVTLTCATPGSGLVRSPANPFGQVVLATAPDVVVSHLVIDGSTGGSTLRVTSAGPGVMITGNTVTCGTSCLFFTGVANATVSDNTFVAPGGGNTGLHFQGVGAPAPDGSRPLPIDGTRVVRNTIVTEVPRGAFPFGAIRVRDGAGVTVAQNRIQGPWSQGIAAANLQVSEFSANRVDGAQNYGLTEFASGFLTGGHVVRNNRFSGGGAGGAFLASSCGSTFIGNNLNGNAGDVGVVFDVSTGSNTLVGNSNVVVDNGDFDCDGDGSSDPNVIGGKGSVLTGVNLGSIVSQAASATDASGIH